MVSKKCSNDHQKHFAQLKISDKITEMLLTKNGKTLRSFVQAFSMLALVKTQKTKPIFEKDALKIQN